MFKKIDNLLHKIEPPNWVLGILALTFILRIPSLFEPYYYGDEMIYLTLGNAIRNGITLYKQIYDNKPPLIYITAAIAGNLFWFRAILMFWMFATIVAFWHLTKNLFKENKKAQMVSVSIFALLTTLPLLEGQIVNAELFLIGPIILAIVILLSKPTYRNIIISGFLFAVAALFKIPAVFDMPVLIIFWLITAKTSKDLILIIKRTIVLSVAFAIPIFLSFVFYFSHNALGDYFKAAFLQNIGYISAWNGSGQTSFVVKHGPLLIRAGIVILGFIFLRVFNKKLSKSFLISSIWLLTSLFAVTLSERPYPHYLIQAVPAISLLIGILVASENFEQVLTIFPLTLAVFAPIYYHFWYYPTIPYYANFIRLAAGNESKAQYFNNIDATTENNYQIATEIMTQTASGDKIFVWGDEAPTIYALTKRLPPIKYVADYHITGFSTPEQTANDLNQNPPILIIILPKAPIYPELNRLLLTKYIMISNKENQAQIWRLLAK